MLFCVVQRGRKRQVHFEIRQPQCFIREWLFIRRERELRKLLRPLQRQLVHQTLRLSVSQCREMASEVRLAHPIQAICGGERQHDERNRGDFCSSFHSSSIGEGSSHSNTRDSAVERSSSY